MIYYSFNNITYTKPTNSSNFLSCFFPFHGSLSECSGPSWQRSVLSEGVTWSDWDIEVGRVIKFLCRADCSVLSLQLQQENFISPPQLDRHRGSSRFNFKLDFKLAPGQMDQFNWLNLISFKAYLWSLKQFMSIRHKRRWEIFALSFNSPELRWSWRKECNLEFGTIQTRTRFNVECCLLDIFNIQFPTHFHEDQHGIWLYDLWTRIKN